ncbi:MAG: F0F1 ATP synthase subunit alpha [Kiloniellales bacterium]
MNKAAEERASLVKDALEAALAATRETSPELRFEEVGRVRAVGAGVADVEGLKGVFADEILEFPSKVRGIVGDLSLRGTSVILLDPADRIGAGDLVRRSKKVAEVPVGPALVGRVVDPLGRPLDGRAPVKEAPTLAVEVAALPISARAPVKRPLATGIKIVDAAVPVGLGQRQLVIGDRQTGKTSLAVDCLLNQRDNDIVCVYCAIGQRSDAVARVIAALREGGMLERCILVVASGDAPAGLAFLAPYAATAMAEHFVAQGRDSLVIYDDLTRHARAYRELSLLLHRPPGREAYPGDIFYLHARLLERAGQFSKSAGGGSLTALPVVETQAENLAAYIPTNLISITDGQIYLSPRLFQKGRLPAVDLGRSVSRVGGKAQHPTLRAIASDLRIAMSQFEELEIFARFGTQLDAETEAKLKRGRALRGVLLQGERHPLAPLPQMLQLAAATAGQFDQLTAAALSQALERIEAAGESRPDLAERLARSSGLGKDLQVEISSLAQEAVDAVA